jgi:predicted MFS family arabinose efflux permease
MSALARRQAVAVFLAFAFTYLFAALLRAVTATLSPTLTREFQLDAGALGLLAGGYFLGFAATQLPLGTWLDRHGPKKVLLGFLIAAVAGCAAFALATSFAGLLAARMLCGAGVGACLMAPLTGYRRWLEPAAQLRANSWMLMAGSLGMVASTLPVQWLVPVFGWRPLFWAMAAGIAVAMVIIWCVVPAWHAADAPRKEPAGSYADVWRHPYFRRMAPLGFINYGGMIAIQTLWAGPWMVRVAGFEPLQAAEGLFAINLCMLAAFWTWGMANPGLARRGLDANRLIAWGLPSSFVAMAWLVVRGPDAGAGALAFFCVASTFGSIVQPAVGLAFPAALAGRALSAFNLVLFLGVFSIQWGIGLAIDAFRAGGLAEVDAFRCALAVFGVCSVMAYGYFLLANRHNRDE